MDRFPSDLDVNPRARSVRVVTDHASYPLAVYVGGRRFPVTEIHQQWHEAANGVSASDCDWFAVSIGDGRMLEIFHDLANSLWYLQRTMRRPRRAQPAPAVAFPADGAS